jgi:hypothetical protein
MKPNKNAEVEDLCINYSRRSLKFLPTPVAGVGTEKWWKNRVKNCVGNVHVNLANDRH